MKTLARSWSSKLVSCTAPLALAFALGTTAPAGANPLHPLRTSRAETELCPGANRGGACPDLVELEVKDVIPLHEVRTHAVVLVTKDHERVVPIFVDEGAAVAIAFRLAHRATPEPLSQDLLDGMVSQLGGTVTSVKIDDVNEHILLSHVYVRQGHKRLGFNARPSDAVSMALAGNARIWATKEVVQQAGISRSEIEELRHHSGMGVGGSPRTPEQAKPGKGTEISL